MSLKKITLLHSNDLHGDFMAKEVDRALIGGVSMLSGYISKTRNEEENVLYTISGDMFRGSLIDSEYKGISTIEIMNALTPDVACIGNHEVDYGIAHLLFLEKCARFPIINANVYIKTNHVRLFKGHTILSIDGMKILFIGIITQEVLAQTKQEKYIGSFVDVEEASAEVGKICNGYQTEDIDFTVLLTHIGIDADKELARLLKPEWGVDLIIGGHTHTILEEPLEVNGIPIVQAGSGTNQIGRFDIFVNTNTNSIEEYTWKLVPIDENYCPRDPAIEALINKYKDETDKKYGRYITRFKNVYTHPTRDRESELGRLFADILADALGLDLMLLSSGSLRKESMGPIVDYRDLLVMFPFSREVIRIVIDGKHLKKCIHYMFRKEVFTEGVHTEFYQFSHDIHFVVNCSEKSVSDLTYQGKEIEDDQLFRVGIQVWHFRNLEDFFGLSKEEVEAFHKPKVVATDELEVIDEMLSQMELVEAPMDERWVTIE